MCAIANRLDLSNKCLRGNSSSRPQSSHPVQVRSGDGGLSVPEMGMCPGKSRQSWKRAKPQRTVQERSQDTVIYPLLKSPPLPPTPVPPQQIQQRKKKREQESQTKQSSGVCKQSRSTLALCRQRGPRGETQRQTSGFNEGDRCPLGGPLRQLLTDCLSTAGLSKPPENT